MGCASGGPRAALGWSLGGEAHVFFTGDRFARDYYEQLTGSPQLADSLERRPLVSVQATQRRIVQVFSASGGAPAAITLARFHARGRCGFDGIVTELVLAFPEAARASTSHIPPAHKPVVGLLDRHDVSRNGPRAAQPPLNRTDALALLNGIVGRAANKAALVRPLALDPDQAADAGEVVPLGVAYGVGFRARVLGSHGDTVLVTGVASTDRDLRHLHWIVKPRRVRLVGGAIPRATRAVRYSLRGAIAGSGALALIDEFADVSADDSRETAVSVESRRVIAAQPLALRCP